ncbi:MAG: YcxB family protein [Exilispira sp.]
MREKIIFTGKMNEKDFKNLFYYQTASKIIFIIPLYIFVIAALLYLIKILSTINISILKIIFVSSTSSILFVFIYILLLYNRLKKDFTDDLKIIKEQTYIIDDDRISILVDGRKTDLLFSNINKIKESKNFFIIYHKTNIVIAIPKRFINDKDIHLIKEIFAKIK